jgi:predicted ATPase
LALTLAEKMERMSEGRHNEAALLLGHSIHGFQRLNLGELATARALLEHCHEMSDPAHRAMYTAMTGADQYIIMLVYLGVTLTYVGHIDQGRARLKQALSAARQVGHAYTLAFTLGWTALCDGVARSPREAQEHAEETESLSNEHEFPVWSGAGMLLRGWALTELTKAQEGLSLITKGLAVYRATGAVYNSPFLLQLQAEAHARLESPLEGLSCLAEAEQIIETTDERFNEAELYRIRGHFLNATGDRAAAEQSYHRALAVAKRQGAKLFELRAANSLARLWRDQGKHAAASYLLAPVYGWFTEGFDTLDLKEAKALLDTLAS